MALKFVWFFCGFLVSLSSVNSLECNVKYCVDDQCFAPETQQCPVGDCSYACRTLKYTYNYNRYVVGNCSSQCDEDDFCTWFNGDIIGDVTDCALTCCYGDLCNERASDEETTQTTKLDNKELTKKLMETKEVLDKLETFHPKVETSHHKMESSHHKMKTSHHK